MVEIKIKGSNRGIFCDSGSNLLQILLEHEIFVDNPCNGTGICGKSMTRHYHIIIPRKPMFFNGIPMRKCSRQHSSSRTERFTCRARVLSGSKP